METDLLKPEISYPRITCIDSDKMHVILSEGKLEKLSRCIKIRILEKKVGVAIKSKETSSQLELVRNSYVAVMHQPVTISLTM